MAARFTPARGLDAAVARLVAPAVQDIGDRVGRAAAGRAPQVKVWRTEADDRVRPWHKSAHRQAVPANLRFKLEHSPRTYHNFHPPGFELLRYPRDPKAYYLQTRDCRCTLGFTDALAGSIRVGRAVVSGARVTVAVWTRFKRAAESEFGSAEDVPARFMGGALRDVARTL